MTELDRESYWGNTKTIIKDQVGMVSISFYNESPDIAYIHDLVVIPPQRRKGYGRQLVDKAIEYIESKKASCINLRADIRFAWLVDFYRGLGFEVMEEDEHTYLLKKWLK